MIEMMPIGRLIQKIQAQEILSTMMPLKKRPDDGRGRPDGRHRTLHAAAFFELEEIADNSHRHRLDGAMPSPCSSRNSTSDIIDQASPQSKEPTRKIRMPPISTGLRPKMSESLP